MTTIDDGASARGDRAPCGLFDEVSSGERRGGGGDIGGGGGGGKAVLYGAFIAANPQFLELTAQRVESYWNCYYRHSFRRDEYPGFALIASLRCAAAAVAAMR